MNTEQDRINFLIAIKRSHGDERRALVRIYESRYGKAVSLYEIRDQK